MTALTRHPLHASVLESFVELRERPATETANFVATISRILSDTFIVADPAHHMPAFMTDRGVSILRFAAGDPGGDGRITAGEVTLSAPRSSLTGLLADETLRAGGTLAFFDPIYEDSFVLVRMTRAAQGEWALRICDTVAA